MVPPHDAFAGTAIQLEYQMDQFTERTVEANDINLHIVEAGPEDGPLLFLLHGFPEFWFEWREQIEPLAAAGYRVVAPDQRGYNLSAKPKGVDNYRLEVLANDIIALAAALGHKRFHLVGHDWGGTIGWWIASHHPDRIERLAVLNAPHPAVWRTAMMSDPEQRAKSRYVQILRLPLLPEALLRVGDYAALRKAFDTVTRPEAFDADTMTRYIAAWRQPGALTGMINWYRAFFRQDLPVPAKKSITAPTLLIWGGRDEAAIPSLADLSAALCADIRLEHWAEATHWTPHDNPRRVTATLLDFLRGASASPA